ncbi:MAG: hypothetical protein IKU11_02435 [Clostridia bacterium]|nr:hypothetical protein [Clostridia bacterium]
MLKKTFTYGRLVFGTLLAIVFAYIIYQVGIALRDQKIQTVHVSLETAGQTVEGTALLVRDEVVLPDITQPYYSLTRSDGEKVASGDHYVRVFSSSAESNSYFDRLSMQTVYDRLSAIQTTFHENYELSDVNQDIQALLAIRPNPGQDFSVSAAVSSELGDILAMRHYALTDEANLEDILNYYTMRLSSSSESYGTLLTTSVGGYYSSTADGFEAILNMENASNISCKEVQKYISDPAVHTTAFASCPGRIVTDYRWKFLLPANAEDAKALKLDKRYQVSIMGDRITATLTSVSPEIEGMVVLEFTSSADIGKYSAYRTAEVTVVIEEYTGYRIPIDAMRMIDGKTGVFCLQGYAARYVEVDILWKTDRYYIVDADLTSEDGLFTNDYVIVNTKGIYDGKVVTNTPLSN